MVTAGETGAVQWRRLPLCVCILLGLVFMVALQRHFAEVLVALDSEDAGNRTFALPLGDERRLRGVPFHVYESPLFELFDTCNHLSSHTSGEWEFLHLIERHPWRVYDPQDAVLFIVPIAMGSVIRGFCPDVDSKAIQDLTDFVVASPYYQRHHGADHFVASTDWKTRSIPTRWTPFWMKETEPDVWKPFWKIANNFIFAHMGSFRKRPWRCTVVAPYSVPPETNVTATKTKAPTTAAEYLAGRPYNFFFQGQTYPNPGYDLRRAAAVGLKGVLEPNIFVSSKRPNPELPHCDAATVERMDELLGNIDSGNMTMPKNLDEFPKMPPCYSEKRDTFGLRLRYSKLNLMFKGDDPSSARVFDSIARRIVTLVLSDGLRHSFTPFECLVDWENLVLWGSEKEFRRNPKTYLTNYVNALTPADYERVLRAMDRHQADVDWYHPQSRVATNILYSAAEKCLPRYKERMRCLYEDGNGT